jgi:phage gpG-like protein
VGEEVGVELKLNSVNDLLRSLEARTLTAEMAPPLATEAMAKILVANVKDALDRASHLARTPTPAAPGEPPAKVTGALRDSVRVTGRVAVLGRAEARVAPTTSYARVQELGGWTGAGHAAYLPARPYLRPTLLKSLAELEAAALAVFVATVEGTL